jgi:hypothetical protein
VGLVVVVVELDLLAFPTDLFNRSRSITNQRLSFRSTFGNGQNWLSLAYLSVVANLDHRDSRSAILFVPSSFNVRLHFARALISFFIT